MGKKRQSEDSAESHTPAKREKALEFNGTAFKAMLKEPSTAMKGKNVHCFIQITLTALIYLLIISHFVYCL